MAVYRDHVVNRLRFDKSIVFSTEDLRKLSTKDNLLKRETIGPDLKLCASKVIILCRYMVYY